MQHWWETAGWTTGVGPLVAVSAELVVYDEGGAEAAIAAFAATPSQCPTRTMEEDGSVVTFEAAESPRGALPGTVALRSTATLSDGTVFQQVIVAQPVDDVVAFLYVTAMDATATTQAARISTILATRLTALAGQVDQGTGA